MALQPIGTPGDGNPCYTVDSSGRIEAHGTFDGDLRQIIGAVLSGIPSSIPASPAGITHQQVGFVGPGSGWHFEIRSGDNRRVPGAQGGCQPNMLVVWGFFPESSNPDYKNKPFRGQSGSGTCSGLVGSSSVPVAFDWAPAQLVMEVAKVSKAVESGEGPTRITRSKRAKTTKTGKPNIKLYEKRQYVLNFDTDGSSLDAPVWTLAAKKQQPYGVPEGVEEVKLQILPIDGQNVGVLACLEKVKESRNTAYRRNCWTARGWDFCGMNWLHIEPYGRSESDAPPWIIKPK